MIASLTLVLVVAGVAQSAAAGGSGPDRAADSVRTFKYVRSAQASFEAFRRARLPRGESSGGECDVRIGRFCYWRGEGEDEPDDPPPELPVITTRRNALIRLLDSAATLLPGDQWIAGQRVRYLAEVKRTDEGLAAAAECRAAAWWCAALGGYAAHLGGRFATADSLFEVALDEMPPAQRCEWMDIREVVDDDLERPLAQANCTAREAMARRIFWLGAPMWSVSQTDLLTEHLARLTQTRIAEQSASPDGVGWANDIRALVLRYGWSRWFTRTEPSFGSTLDAQITGHDFGMPYYFLPSRRTLDHGPGGDPGWSLNDQRAVSGYAPSFIRSVHQLSSQVAAFRRGESTLVIAAWDVRKDSTLVGRDLDAALVLATPVEARQTVIEHGRRAAGSLAASAVLDSGWVSLELLASKDRRGGRLRIGLPPRRADGRVGLSDLLLYAPTDAVVRELTAARDSALGNNSVPFSRALGVYWELYGIAPQGENTKFSLTVEQVDIGWMQRAADRLRFSDPTTATRVQWQEFIRPTDGISGRGVRIDLAGLRSGKYRLELSATTDDGSRAMTSRVVELHDR